jgi:DHA3 family macrolide efflux protein-like MFS transporter
MMTGTLYRNREFRKYLTGTALTAIGNGMHFVAITWYLYHWSDTVFSVGMVMIMATLPGMFLTPMVGILLDGWDSRWVCITTDLIRASAYMALIYFLNDRSNVPAAIYAASFVASVCQLFYQPAASALVRDIASGSMLLRANVASSVCMQMGMLCGASLGGLLVMLYGAPLVIFINVLSFFISAAFTLWIEMPARTARTKPRRSDSGYREEIAAGYSYIRGSAFLIWPAVVQISGAMTLYVSNTLLPAFVSRELRGGPGLFGMMDGAWGAGAMCGGFTLAFMAKRLSRDQLLLYGPLALSGTLVLFLTSHDAIQAVLGYFSVGFFVCANNVHINTLLATEIDPWHFGKVKSVITFFVSWLSVVLYSGVGYIGDLVSVRWIFLSVSMCILAAVVSRFVRERVVA